MLQHFKWQATAQFVAVLIISWKESKQQDEVWIESFANLVRTNLNKLRSEKKNA